MLGLRSIVKFEILVCVDKLIFCSVFFILPLMYAAPPWSRARLWCRSTGGQGNC